VVAVFTMAMLRVAAISDARREGELSEWVAMSVLADHRAADAGGHAERLPSEARPGFHRATG
jgi:hypothetical protein